MQTEQEQRSHGVPIPVKILTVLENSTELQLQDNIKRFKRDLQRYNNEEWLTPERINGSLYSEL